MAVTFLRTIMKNAVKNCTQISDNKEVAKVWIRSFTETDILLYSQRDNRGIKYFHHIKTLKPIETSFSFLANPYDLEELLKGRDKKRTWNFSEINGNSYIVDDNGGELEIELFDGKFPLEKLPYIKMNDSEGFANLLELITKSSTKEVQKIEIGGYEASIKNSIYTKRFNLNEEFSKFIFPLDYIKQLKSNIIWPKKNKNIFSFCSKENSLYIRLESENKKKPEESFRILFVLSQSDTSSPTLKQLEPEIVHTFSIDVEKFWQLLNSYPATITDVYLYNENEHLVIDPYDKAGEPLEEHEDQPIHKISYTGNVKRTKIERTSLMSLLVGYEGKQDIQIVKYIEDDEEIYGLQLYNKYIYSLVLSKKEPNYSKLQSLLDQFLDYEKNLTFLNE